jgi:hypothetical protein
MNIVEKQLEAYNNQNLTEFLSYYDDNIKVSMLQSNQVLANDVAELKEIMESAFGKHATSYSQTIKTITQGNLVINQEKITGHEPGKIITTISIYEINDANKITRLWFGGRVADDIK